jgi:two-component system, cell cycle response regulator
VVEDSPIARRFLQVRLQRLGYAVTVAGDAQEAVTWLQSRTFALVFLDVGLGPVGGLDGLNLCQMIKQDPAFALARPARVVMVSGLSAAMDRVRGSLAGCDAYLTKPVTQADFQRTLSALDPTLARRQLSLQH